MLYYPDSCAIIKVYDSAGKLAIVRTEVCYMPKLTPQAVAAKWQSRMSAAGDSYKQGVNAVQNNPAQAAIAAKATWLANIQAAAANGRYEQGLSKVSLQDWKTAATSKGAPALVAAAQLGAVKVQANETKWGPIRDQVVASLPARGTLEQNIQRAAAMARGMAQAAGRS